MLEPEGWSPAPAFDINPNPQGDGLTLNISETDNSQELDLARSVRKHFRVSEKRAEAIIREVAQAMRSWNKVAGSLKIFKEEQARMAPAFRLAAILQTVTQSRVLQIRTSAPGVQRGSRRMVLRLYAAMPIAEMPSGPE